MSKIAIAMQKLAQLRRGRLITGTQACFLERIIHAAQNSFPDLETSGDTVISVFKKGVEVYNEFGVRAFYIDNDTGFYYQYQWGLYDQKYIEPSKTFDSFSEDEVSCLLKRETLLIA
jgi:hypothetical protein